MTPRIVSAQEWRAHEHVLVIVGDMLARRLEWMIEEPTSGFDAELLDVIKERAARDVAQWLAAIANAGFRRPDAHPLPATPADGGERNDLLG